MDQAEELRTAYANLEDHQQRSADYIAEAEKWKWRCYSAEARVRVMEQLLKAYGERVGDAPEAQARVIEMLLKGEVH